MLSRLTIFETGSYIVVFDIVIEDLPASLAGNRPWAYGDNPKMAVYVLLKEKCLI